VSAFWALQVVVGETDECGDNKRGDRAWVPYHDRKMCVPTPRPLMPPYTFLVIKLQTFTK